MDFGSVGPARVSVSNFAEAQRVEEVSERHTEALICSPLTVDYRKLLVTRRPRIVLRSSST